VSRPDPDPEMDPDLDPDRHRPSDVDGKLTGHGDDDPYGTVAPELRTHRHAKRLPPVVAAEPGADQSRRGRARVGWDAPRPRPGWYAYRIAGPAELPSWAAEVALTIERPPDPDPDRSASRTSSPSRPADPEWAEDQVQAMVLLRAPGRMRWLSGATEAVAGIERAAGLRAAGRIDEVADVPGMGARLLLGARLLQGPGLPGLVPVVPAVALAGMRAAGARGLPAPLRRWRPAAGPMAWRASAGAVVTCEGPYGVSAQAVVALRGLGNVLAIAPPPGGALVLRAWRTRRTWGMACGLVVGRDSELGLGRAAGRVAARARADGWQAAVLNGPTALRLARAGDPGAAAPEAAAHAASASQVTALFEACLMAGVLDRPPAGSRWTLAVTP
jgi:hypothetical protein